MITKFNIITKFIPSTALQIWVGAQPVSFNGDHLDRLPIYSDYRPKLIIRTAVGGISPLNPGPQHDGDFSDAFQLMCKTVKVIKINQHMDILEIYKAAYYDRYSTIIVE